MRFLFVYPGALGDLLLAAPVFKTIQKVYPGAQIGLAGRLPYTKILPLLGLVDIIYSMEERRFLPLFKGDGLPEDLHQFFASFDAIIFWISNFYSDIRFFPIPVKIVNPRAVVHPAEHHAQYLYHSVQSFLKLPEQNVSGFYLDNFSAEHLQPVPLLLVHPGSGSQTKNWPLENFLKLAEKWQIKYHGRAVFLFGPAEESLLKIFQKETRDQNVRVVHSTDFEKIIKLLQSADFYLGNDSGISHLSGLLNKRGLIFFRTTEPQIWQPLGRRLISVKVE
ncbi:lipopolysaccharide core biosynthesis protein [bacterium BMS3Abin05]|nr:lipopolysaccharide core biosynthesis protein [bacterium BMS3Abin05]GBE28351.1 lipopolysaccharide core biosynthesis protein [bacterium BMS3Bbin03]HDL78196.1 lipopolysaccharide heptosyltransferase family protein [Bacteroidota bacterium]